jgi:hypothetical protein
LAVIFAEQVAEVPLRVTGHDFTNPIKNRCTLSELHQDIFNINIANLAVIFAEQVLNMSKQRDFIIKVESPSARIA